MTSPQTVSGYIGGNVAIIFNYAPVLDDFTDVTWKFGSFTDTTLAEVVYYYEGPPGFDKISFPPLKGRSSHRHGNNTLTLYIYNVTRSDEGVYTCIFKAGNEKMASTHLSKYYFNPILPLSRKSYNIYVYVNTIIQKLMRYVIWTSIPHGCIKNDITAVGTQQCVIK